MFDKWFDVEELIGFNPVASMIITGGGEEPQITFIKDISNMEDGFTIEFELCSYMVKQTNQRSGS